MQLKTVLHEWVFLVCYSFLTLISLLDMGLLNISSWVAKEQPFTSLLKGKVLGHKCTCQHSDLTKECCPLLPPLSSK